MVWDRYYLAGIPFRSHGVPSAPIFILVLLLDIPRIFGMIWPCWGIADLTTPKGADREIATATR